RADHSITPHPVLAPQPSQVARQEEDGRIDEDVGVPDVPEGGEPGPTDPFDVELQGSEDEEQPPEHLTRGSYPKPRAGERENHEEVRIPRMEEMSQMVAPEEDVGIRPKRGGAHGIRDELGVVRADRIVRDDVVHDGCATKENADRDDEVHEG